jgi:DNA repair photolyase
MPTLKVREISASSILTQQKVGSLSQHYDFTINPYAGCAFACSYCYVPKFPNREHTVEEWGSWINVKINAPELLRKERTRIFGSRVFFSSATDPYQYVELKYRLTRACLKELLKYQPAAVTMHTRSHLMMQDIDLLREFGGRLQVGLSLPTDDEEIRKQFEPNAPSIARRLSLLHKLVENGIAVYVSMSPLLPCNPERLVRLVQPYTSRVWVDTLRWLEVMRQPQLLQKYEAFFEEEKYQALAENVAASFQQSKKNFNRAEPEKGVRAARVMQLALGLPLKLPSSSSH